MGDIVWITNNISAVDYANSHRMTYNDAVMSEQELKDASPSQQDEK